MAYPAWNLDKLPYPARDNFSVGYQHPLTQNQMDTGRYRNRRRWNSQPQNYSLTWYMTWDQVDYFEAFLKYDVALASGYFTMALNAVSDQITVRFTAYPKIAYDSSRQCWVVTGTVEWPRAAPTGGKITTLQQFPTSLPPPEQANYSISRDDTVTRSTELDGTARQRSRFDQQWALVTMEWNFTPDQFVIWDDFVHNKLFGGLAPFMGYFANGEGLNMVQVQFTTLPTVSQNGANYTVQGTLQITDIPTMSYIRYKGDDAITFSDSITFTESISFRINRGAFSDSFTLTDSLSFRITHPLSDSLTYSESIAITQNDQENYVDSFGFSETVAFYIQKGALADAFTLTATGSIMTEEYATGYVELAYNNITTAFTN